MKTTHTLAENEIYVEHSLPQNRAFESPLVLVHGSFGGFWMWNTIVPVLVDGGFECVTFSLRGHAPSGGKLGQAGMTDYVEDLSLVIRNLELKDPVAVGQSMAGLAVLMYAGEYPVRAVVSIDPSPSLEVQGPGSDEAGAKIPDVYTPMEAGMPADPAEAMRALPDVPKDVLLRMGDMFGPESGKARRERKRGISVPRESIAQPILFIGAEHGDSVEFGISFESTRQMAEYYGSELVEIQGATHPGILIGEHAPEVARSLSEWVINK